MIPRPPRSPLFPNTTLFRSTSRNAFARQTIRGGKAPGTIRQNANAEADRFALCQRADLAVLCREVALAQMHHAHIAVRSAAQLGRIKSVCREIPHACKSD